MMAPAATTDVRAWLREQGHEIGDRGAIAGHLRDEYDRAHEAPPGKTVQGELLDSSYPYPDAAAGVTEADFPPDDDTPGADPFDSPDGQTYSEPATTTTGTGRRGRRGTGRAERQPRTVKPAAPAGGLRERLFGGPKAGPGKPKQKAGPRVSLSDWAEETWSDLAWLAQPIPPLAKMLTIQAPYAGAVFDNEVKGTVIDAMLQPVAKYSGKFRALNGLAGPPVYVGMICAVGAREVVGKDAAGQDVYDYDARTKMLFQGLRYSLLQMTKIAEVNADQIQERTQASAERMAAVEMMIASIFGMEPDGPVRPAQPAYSAQPPAGANGYAYPDAPVMDGTGADPGRL